MSLRNVLTAARASGTSAFIPFIMAGDPDMETAENIIVALEAAGADALELGVPFSDPVADGVTVQKASERALAKGATLNGVLDLVKRLRARGGAVWLVFLRDQPARGHAGQRCCADGDVAHPAQSPAARGTPAR